MIRVKTTIPLLFVTRIWFRVYFNRVSYKYSQYLHISFRSGNKMNMRITELTNSLKEFVKIS